MDRIIAQSEEEFRHGVTSLRAKDLAAIMSLIQREMRQEQDEFNRLTERLGTMDEESKDFAYLEKARLQSQNRLSSLMTKSMICLDQETNTLSSNAKPSAGDSQPLRSNHTPPSSAAATYSPATSFGSATLASSVQKEQTDAGARRRQFNNDDEVTRPEKVSVQQKQSNTDAHRGRLENDVEVTRVMMSSPQADKSPKQQERNNQPEETDEDELRTVNARSLIANFERLSSSGSGDTVPRPPRRSASAFVLNASVSASQNVKKNTAPSGNGSLPHSRSAAQLVAKPESTPVITKKTPPLPPPLGARNIQIVTRTPSAPPPQPTSSIPTTPRFNGGVVVGDEKVLPPASLKDWDPTKLLRHLYDLTLLPEDEENASGLTCRGIMDRLPDQKKKTTMLKTWKRRFFVAEAGELRSYDPSDKNPGSGPPAAIFQLSGGHVDDLGDLMIGLDDGCGRFVTVRCLNAEQHMRWLRCLRSQADRSQQLSTVIPREPSIAGVHPTRHVVIVDIGSCSVRAGLLGASPTIPTLYFPCVASLRNTDQNEVVAVGADAFMPYNRVGCQLIRPVRAETTIERVAFDRGILRAIFDYIFKQLRVQPDQYTVMLSVPHTTNEDTRGRLVDLLLNGFKCPAVSMCGQAMLALYAYGLTTGIVVDLGHRMEILAVTDGVVQRGGVSRQPYGGSRIAAMMNLHLSELGCRFHSDTEALLTQYCVEQAAYVCSDPAVECDVNNDHETVLDMSQFDLPPDFISSVSLLANGRCSGPEGLFKPSDFFGMDTPSMPRLVQRAIAACPMDLRRDLARRIVLSGGCSLLPGLIPRLEAELGKLLPPLSVVRVHGSPNRLHAAFMGACRLAAMPEFEAQCLTQTEWRQRGVQAVRGKWAV